MVPIFLTPIEGNSPSQLVPINCYLAVRCKGHTGITVDGNVCVDRASEL